MAACELGVLAGADRVEGTLFGNGERTGNLDIVTMALNRLADGIDPGLDFTDLPRITRVYEHCTRMSVPPRHPYAGELVFTAFSGSHQDAIKKGMDLRGDNPDAETPWTVPYLHIDPQDIGRSYESIVRINSQSGKGGVAYVLSREYGFEMPKTMHVEMGKAVKTRADSIGRELTINEIYEEFNREFLRKTSPLEFIKATYKYEEEGDDRQLMSRVMVRMEGKEVAIEGKGNGPISAFVHAMNNQGWQDFKLTDFHEHSIGQGAETEAMAYVQIELSGGRRFWGAAIDSNIDYAGTRALVSAYNRSR